MAETSKQTIELFNNSTLDGIVINRHLIKRET